jgi:hypothetical protein
LGLRRRNRRLARGSSSATAARTTPTPSRYASARRTGTAAPHSGQRSCAAVALIFERSSGRSAVHVRHRIAVAPQPPRLRRSTSTRQAEVRLARKNRFGAGSGSGSDVGSHSSA